VAGSNSCVVCLFVSFLLSFTCTIPRKRPSVSFASGALLAHFDWIDRYPLVFTLASFSSSLVYGSALPYSFALR